MIFFRDGSNVVEAIPIKLVLPDGRQLFIDAEKDEHGVLRYRRNSLIDVAFDTKAIDLNRLAVLYQTNDVDLADVIIFWSMLGYSVDGMCDLSFMQPVAVYTPTWHKPAYNEEGEEI